MKMCRYENVKMEQPGDPEACKESPGIFLKCRLSTPRQFNIINFYKVLVASDKSDNSFLRKLDNKYYHKYPRQKF